MNNNKTKNIILAVLVIGLVGMTIAYASLTQTLTITNNQATVSSNWRVRFGPTVTTSVGTTINGTTTGASYTQNTPVLDNDRQTIKNLQATFTKPGDYVEVAFTVRNEGNIAAKGSSTTLVLGDLSCEPGTNSGVTQAEANTFCGKLTKWVKHSDRTTNWTSADTLAAYSGSGDYPSIDGILRIEMPSTLESSDLAALSKGSIVVTLGDTTLSFEQDDNPPLTWSQLVGNVTDGFDSFKTPTQKYGSSTLPDNEPFWIQQNTSTGDKEVCGVFPSGTVCLIKASDRSSEFTDASNGNVTGYALQKKTEMESAGASCTVYSMGVTCVGSGMQCNMKSRGSVSCYNSDGSHQCGIDYGGFASCS